MRMRKQGIHATFQDRRSEAVIVLVILFRDHIKPVNLNSSELMLTDVKDEAVA